MKNISLLLLFCFALLLNSCKDGYKKNVWLYSDNFNGIGYMGAVIDFSEQPLKLYSIFGSSVQDSIKFKNNLVTHKQDTLIEFLWENENCLVAKHFNDTIIFQVVPDLGLSDRYQEVLELLTKNSFIYQDNFGSYKVQYDTTILDPRFRKSIIFLNSQDGMMGSWNLKKVNNSLILYNSNPFSFNFSEYLLIQEIYEDSIIAISLEVPENEYDNFHKAVVENKDFQFEYEKYTLKKMPGSSVAELKNILDTLCSKIWVAKKVDTTLIRKNTPIGKRDPSRFYKKSSYNIKYKFSDNGSYSFILKETSYSGNYTLSRDGKHILLDSTYRNSDFIELIEVSKNRIKVHQPIVVKESEKEKSSYFYEIEFE